MTTSATQQQPRFEIKESTVITHVKRHVDNKNKEFWHEIRLAFEVLLGPSVYEEGIAKTLRDQHYSIKAKLAEALADKAREEDLIAGWRYIYKHGPDSTLFSITGEPEKSRVIVWVTLRRDFPSSKDMPFTKQSEGEQLSLGDVPGSAEMFTDADFINLTQGVLNRHRAYAEAHREKGALLEIRGAIAKEARAAAYRECRYKQRLAALEAEVKEEFKQQVAKELAEFQNGEFHESWGEVVERVSDFGMNEVLQDLVDRSSALPESFRSTSNNITTKQYQDLIDNRIAALEEEG